MSQHANMLNDLWDMYQEAYTARTELDEIPALQEKLAFYAGVCSGLSVAERLMSIMGPQALEILKQRNQITETILKGIEDAIRTLTDNEDDEQSASGGSAQ